MIQFILEINFKESAGDHVPTFIVRPDIVQHHSTENVEFITWGDPILSQDFYSGLEKDPTVEFIINQVCGHYYYILINKRTHAINFGNSLFSILPVYYAVIGHQLIFSDNSLTLGDHLGIQRLSKSFILETLLFNYPIFNPSILENIKLLPSNSSFYISGGEWKITKHTRIELYFSGSAESFKNAVKIIPEIFLDRVSHYLPDEHYISALTGGFDGRTLVSAGLYHKKEFSCYSFGSGSSQDTLIAEKLCGKSGIPFINVQLNNEYIKGESLECGLEFIRGSSGIATFARAHYLYAAKRIAAKAQYVLTGNFGSEIFRAVHNSGIVFSPNLIALFSSSNDQEAIQAIQRSREFDGLIINNFKNEWTELKEKLLSLPCFNIEYKHLTRNQKFYVFVFEEVFRKYFGAEMVNQFQYIKNRTPYLDIQFLKAILKTEFAGINSKYFENNPVKRYKGQILYANIIRKAFPLYGGMMTDKGYKPDDLLSFAGKLRIAYSYLKKKAVRKKGLTDGDPYSVNRSFEANRNYFSQINMDEQLFNGKKIEEEVMSTDKNIYFKMISLSYVKEKFGFKL